MSPRGNLRLGACLTPGPASSATPTTSIAGLPFPARQVAAAAVARRRECRAADACQPRTACASGTLTGPAFGRPDVWRRYLAIILDGLRPERGTVTPLPEPPLSPAGIG